MNKMPEISYDYISEIDFKFSQLKKVKEEFEELYNAINNDDAENILEECLDIMQVCISIIKLYSKHKITKAFKFHNNKLENRGWNITNYNNIDI